MQAVLCLLPLRAFRALQRVCIPSRREASHLFDIVCLCVWAVACYALTHVKAGLIYFWMKVCPCRAALAMHTRSSCACMIGCSGTSHNVLGWTLRGASGRGLDARMHV